MFRGNAFVHWTISLSLSLSFAFSLSLFVVQPPSKKNTKKTKAKEHRKQARSYPSQQSPIGLASSGCLWRSSVSCCFARPLKTRPSSLCDHFSHFCIHTSKAGFWCEIGPWTMQHIKALPVPQRTQPHSSLRMRRIWILGPGWEGKFRGLVLEALWPTIFGARDWQPSQARSEPRGVYGVGSCCFLSPMQMECQFFVVVVPAAFCLRRGKGTPKRTHRVLWCRSQSKRASKNIHTGLATADLCRASAPKGRNTG